MKKKHKNISEIKNVTSLQQLAEYDDIIRQTCKNVINPDDYDEIVQMMYEKITKYINRGTIINSGYVFLILKSINLDLIKEKNKKDINTSFELIDENKNSEEEYEISDDKIRQLDNFLSKFLTQDEIALYKFFKVNGLAITAKFYGLDFTKMRYRKNEINEKIKQNNNNSLQLNYNNLI